MDVAAIAALVSGGGATVLAVLVWLELRGLSPALTSIATSLGYIAKRERDREADEQLARVAHRLADVRSGAYPRAPTPAPEE